MADSPLVVEVRYEHLEGIRFRHTAQFNRWRPDRDPKSFTYEELEEPSSRPRRHSIHQANSEGNTQHADQADQRGPGNAMPSVLVPGVLGRKRGYSGRESRLSALLDHPATSSATESPTPDGEPRP